MKTVIALAIVLVFSVGFTFGVSTPNVNAASFCYYTCGCNGVPVKCCISSFGTFCKPVPNAPIGCPQIADC